MLIEPFPATEKQKAVLAKILPHLSPEEIDKISKFAASRMIEQYSANWHNLPATHPQKGVLRRWSQWRDNMTRGDASDLIADIKARTARLTPEEVKQQIELAKQRQAANEPPNQAAMAEPSRN